MKKKKDVTFWIVIVAVAVVVIIVVINIFVIQNNEYFKISIGQTLTLIVAIVIAFWATQKKTDIRKIKEQVETIISNIQTVVSSSDFITFQVSDKPEAVQKRITMTTRKLKNSINVLNEYSKKIEIKDEVHYIEEQVKGYDNLVSVHITDLDYLSKSEIDLRRYAENINSKCEYLILKLYTQL